MPRLPKTPGQPLTEVLKVRLSATERAQVDAAKGHLSASEWARNSIRASIAGQLHTGETADQQSPRAKTRRPSKGRARPHDPTTEVAPEVPHAAPGPRSGQHRHTPGDWIAERTVKGVTTATYRCAEKGCNVELERPKR